MIPFVVSILETLKTLILWKIADKCSRHGHNCGFGESENVDVVATIVGWTAI